MGMCSLCGNHHGKFIYTEQQEFLLKPRSWEMRRGRIIYVCKWCYALVDEMIGTLVKNTERELSDVQVNMIMQTNFPVSWETAKEIFIRRIEELEKNEIKKAKRFER